MYTFSWSFLHDDGLLIVRCSQLGSGVFSQRHNCLSLLICTASTAFEASPSMQNGWNVKALVGIWHVMVNMVNFADLLLHLSYITVLWQGLKSIAAAAAIQPLWHQPTAVTPVGVSVAYMMARWLPRHGQYHGQQD